MANLFENKIILVILILVVIIGSIWAIYFSINEGNKNAKLTLPNEAEEFFYQNKAILNEFVNLCFVNNIEYIGTQEYSGLTSTKYEIAGFSLYIINDVDEDTKRKLEKVLDIFKDNSISNVYIDINNHSYVSLQMTKYTSGVSINYYTEPKPIETIKENNYSDEAWFIDDNWVIIVSESL